MGVPWSAMLLFRQFLEVLAFIESIRTLHFKHEWVRIFRARSQTFRRPTYVSHTDPEVAASTEVLGPDS